MNNETYLPLFTFDCDELIKGGRSGYLTFLPSSSQPRVSENPSTTLLIAH